MRPRHAQCENSPEATLKAPGVTTTTILACSECGFLVTFLLFKCFWRDLIISYRTLNSWGLPIIKPYWSSHDISGKVWGRGDFLNYGTAWSSFSSQRSLWSWLFVSRSSNNSDCLSFSGCREAHPLTCSCLPWWCWDRWAPHPFW